MSTTDPRVVMLIDDDVMLCELYRVKFEKARFKVLVHHAAEEALQHLREGAHPSIIVLDLLMPGMDGLAFLKEAHEQHLHLPPVVILTNEAQDVTKETAFALGANNYILKASSTPKEVVEQVAEMLSMYESMGAGEAPI